ncbi:MAG TPA: fatty acid desaturase [Geminicoccaceae bacterium]|nr:fatty acid desaturase [Geminicoccaceae bacterium]
MTSITTSLPASTADHAPAPSVTPTAAEELEARRWVQRLARYREPCARRSLRELLLTVGPFLLLWTGISLGLAWGFWPSLLLVVPAAGFLVRMFMIQHDCGHGSFFRRRAPNDWLGRVLGVLTLTPYDYWRRSHAIHHAASGSLSRRGQGDIHTLTVREYRSLGPWRRWLYRVFRSPMVLFGVGPIYLFVLQHRLPVGLMRAGREPWISTMATNLAIGVLVAVLASLVGIWELLLIHGPIVLLAGAAGIWLFYVQHQFEDTYWEDDGQWSFHLAAVRGSSHYDLPAVLRWFTANIGIHHVHHLCSRIPSYRLGEVLRDHPELGAVSRVTLWQSLGCWRLALWDEETRRLIGFREAHAKA